MICHKVLDLYTKSSKTPGKQKSESIQNTPANKKLKLNGTHYLIHNSSYYTLLI